MEFYKKVADVAKGSSLLVGLFEGERILRINDELDEYVSEIINQESFKTSVGTIHTIHTFDKSHINKIHIVGLGKRKDFCLEKQQEAFSKINYTLDKEVVIDVNSFAGDLDIENSIFELVLAIDYNNYTFDQFKTEKTKNEMDLNFLVIENVEETINLANNLSKAIKNTRNLVNLPYNYLNAEALVNYTKNLVEKLENEHLTLEILEKPQLKELEMNAFLSVNQGSKDDPYLIYASYRGGGDSEVITLVGKGVMYDTGGYSLKSSMNTMKCDMAGAATVLGVLEAVVKNEIAVNLDIVIAATDNRVSGDAYLPDDILTAMNKKTIEIVSTDAEGRLTLADALTFAQSKGSKHVIDIATLTGAIGVALGEHTTGVFSNDEEMVKKFLKSAKESNEGAWQLPITPDIRKKVRSSKVADLTNSTGRFMGSSGAAAFLEEFIEDKTKWIHLDVAFTAYNSKTIGATGAMLKTLYHYLETTTKEE